MKPPSATLILCAVIYALALPLVANAQQTVMSNNGTLVGNLTVSSNRTLTINGTLDGAPASIANPAGWRTALGLTDAATGNATGLTSGTLPDARLSSNVLTLTGNQTVTGVKTYTSILPINIAQNFPQFERWRSNTVNVDDGGLYSMGTGLFSDYGYLFYAPKLLANLSTISFRVAEFSNPAKQTASTADTILALTASHVYAGKPILFEGSTVDGNTTIFQATNPTEIRTISLPDASGTLPLLELSNVFTAQQQTRTATQPIYTLMGSSANATDIVSRYQKVGNGTVGTPQTTWDAGVSSSVNDHNFSWSYNNAGGVWQKFLSLTTAGNLGIGTTAPTERLSVTGNATVSGTLTAGGTITTTGTDIRVTGGTTSLPTPESAVTGKIGDARYPRMIGSISRMVTWNSSGLINVVTGSGNATSDASTVSLSTTASAGTVEAGFNAIGVLQRNGGSWNTISWSERRIYKWSHILGTSWPSDSEARIIVGENRSSYSGGDIAVRGFALRITGTSVFASVHDGTTLTESLVGTFAQSTAVHTVTVDVRGTGTIDFYVNALPVVSLSGGPTGSSVTGPCIIAYLANVGTVSSLAVSYFDVICP